MRLSGAEILIHCLKEQGVDTVFGYPGGCVLDIYDAIYRDGTLRHILTAHEQGAAHAAGRLRARHGKDGRMYRHIRPGSDQPCDGNCDGVHGFRSPCGDHGERDGCKLGQGQFPEVDIAGITMPVTKHNYIVKDIGKLASTIREAFYIASSGRKGPVLIDIPKNIQTEQCEFTPVLPQRYVPKAVAADSLKEVADALAKSKRPLLISGGGCIGSNASENLFALAKKNAGTRLFHAHGTGRLPRFRRAIFGTDRNARHGRFGKSLPQSGHGDRLRDALFRPRGGQQNRLSRR